MPRLLNLSCGIPFPVKTPGIISGFTSVVVWLSWGEVIKKKSGNFLRGGEGGKTNFGGEGQFFRSSSLLGHLHF